MEPNRRSISRNPSTKNLSQRIKNTTMMEYPSHMDSLNKWSIPPIPPKEIYHVGTFTLQSQLAIKTMEKTITIGQEEDTIELLRTKDLEHYISKFKYIHIGLIQVAFKPLTLPGLNASILACLRDARCLDWTQSLMGIMQTSLCHGPVYFNVHPNLSLSLTDPNLYKASSLQMKTNGYNFLPGSETIAIIYRIYFRVLNTLAPKAKHTYTPGQNILIETNLLSSQISVNKQIQWNEIQFPNSWLLNQAIPPTPIVERDIHQIIQTPHGDVEISFFQNERKSQIVSSQRTLHSASSFRSDTISQLNPDEVKGAQASTSQIPHPLYKRDKTSPTASEMDDLSHF